MVTFSLFFIFFFSFSSLFPRLSSLSLPSLTPSLLGFMVNPRILDKDGISAAIVAAELAHSLSLRRLTLLDYLDDIYATYGTFVSSNSYYFITGAVVPTARIFERIRGMGGYIDEESEEKVEESEENGQKKKRKVEEKGKKEYFATLPDELRPSSICDITYGIDTAQPDNKVWKSVVWV